MIEKTVYINNHYDKAATKQQIVDQFDYLIIQLIKND